MRRFTLIIPIFLWLAACSLPLKLSGPTPIPPVNTPVPVLTTPLLATETPTSAASTPAVTPTATPLTFEGMAATFGPLYLVIPPGLASGASAGQFPRSEGGSIAPWEVTPGHIRIDLQGYPLQNKTYQPQVFVYPAQAYASMRDSAAQNIQQLQGLQIDPYSPIDAKQLRVPFNNESLAFTSNIEPLSFQNGHGVRFLTQTSQAPVPGNNQDLFYQFQGLTSDGANYVIVIMPINNPILAETRDPAAPLPPNGVPYPDINDPNANWSLYYKSITDVLGATPPDGFTPSLDQLDLLVKSMKINP
jgi:hypothetical protein